MLVLSRKCGEKIHIGNDITITVVEVNGQRVRIGIDAPQNVPILRNELLVDSPMETAGRELSSPVSK